MAATGNAKLAVTMSIVDKATEPLRKINQSVKDAFKPIQAIKSQPGITAAGLGLPGVQQGLVGVDGAAGGLLQKIRGLKNQVKLSAHSWGLPKLKEGFGNVKNAAGGVLKEIKGIGKELAILGGLGAGFFGGMIYSTANAADEAYKAAQKVGVTTESWTKMAHAADMSGVSVTSLQSGMSRLNKGIVEAAAGTGEAGKIFNYLGISIQDQEGKLKNADAMMLEVADKLAAMEDGALKSSIAMGLFGKSAGPDMIPMLNVGRKGMADSFEEAVRLRKVITDEQGQAAESFNDSMARMKKSVEGVFMSLGHQLIPIIEPVFKDIENFFVNNGDLIASTVKGWVDGIRWLVDAFGGWGRVIPVVVGGLATMKLAPLILATATLAKSVFSLGGSLGSTGGKMFLFSKWGKNLVADMGKWGQTLRMVGGAVLPDFTRSIGGGAKRVGSFAGLLGGKLVSALTFLPKVFLAASSAALKFGAALILNPIGIAIAALAGLGYAIYKCVKHWDSIKAAVSKVWEVVKSVFSAGWNMLPGWVQKPLEKVAEIVGSIGGKIWSGITKDWERIKAFFGPTFADIGKIFSDAWTGIGNAVDTVLTNISAAIGLSGDGWGTGVSSALAVVKGFFVEGWDAIWGVFSEKTERIGTAFENSFIGGLIQAVKEFNPLTLFMESLNAVSNWIFGFSLKDAGRELISSLWDGLKEMWASIISWLEEIPGKIKSMIPESFLTLVDKVGGIAGGVGNAATAGFNAVTDAAAGATGWLGDKALGVWSAIGGGASPAPAPAPAMAFGDPVGVENMIRKETLQRSESVKEQRVVVDFANVPEGVSVKPDRGVQTNVERAPSVYRGMRMGGS